MTEPTYIHCIRAGRKIMKGVCHAVQDRYCPECNYYQGFSPFWSRPQNRRGKNEEFYISLVEQGVFTYPGPEMYGWRFYRIEYGGHAEQCLIEGVIWLPPGVNPEQIEDLLKIPLCPVCNRSVMGDHIVIYTSLPCPNEWQGKNIHIDCAKKRGFPTPEG